MLLALYPAGEYLCQLAILNHAATRDELTQPVQDRYLAACGREAAGAVRAALAAARTASAAGFWPASPEPASANRSPQPDLPNVASRHVPVTRLPPVAPSRTRTARCGRDHGTRRSPSAWTNGPAAAALAQLARRGQYPMQIPCCLRNALSPGLKRIPGRN